MVVDETGSWKLWCEAEENRSLPQNDARSWEEASLLRVRSDGNASGGSREWDAAVGCGCCAVLCCVVLSRWWLIVCCRSFYLDMPIAWLWVAFSPRPTPKMQAFWAGCMAR